VAGAASRAVGASPVRTLLGGAIDYAGLFPPASLAMEEAARSYAEYRLGRDAWALGRFVVPIARLDELREQAGVLLPSRAEPPWRLSALAGAGGAAEWAGIEARQGGGVVVEALELRVTTARDVSGAAARVPKDRDVFYEIPIDSDPATLIAAIRSVGGKAKVRTGGVTPDAFPTAANLARFIVNCAAASVPFKATAGLHHALAGRYHLTYEAKSASGEMFGFLNVLFAAAFARARFGENLVAELLAERDATSFRFSERGAEWRGRRLSTDDLSMTRGSLALAFGSCSFREPMEELRSLGLL
jgi:hypothetical protein